MKGIRAWGAAGVAALVATTFVGGSGAAAPPTATASSGAASKIAAATSGRAIPAGTAKWRPPAGDPNRLVRVMVQVKGESVAEAKGDAVDAGATASDAQLASVAAAATTSQDSVVSAIAATGGTVSDRHVTAVNALAASVPASAVAALEDNANVLGVFPVKTYTRDNGTSNAFTGVPTAWQDYGATGKGVKIAVIDTGIDYDHADFGGSGDPADFAANDGTIIEPGSFPTAKVVGGYDFVGDDYNAASTDDPAALIPHPDPDPLDCDGHGSHTAGTAAGQGVLLDGSTFTGPYDASIDPSKFIVSPGSAPEASILSYRVFGCTGSVDDTIIISAIDRAVADGANVISMSLGSDIGLAKSVESLAIDNASRAGVAVVVSAGNPGQAAYLVGAPSTSDRALSVAAVDAHATFPGASISGGAAPITALNANSGPLPVTGNIVVVPDGKGGVGLGCDLSEYPPLNGPTIYVAKRGVCDRVQRAKNGQQLGAVAVVMVNSSADLAPYEGPIPGVTIPFLGVPSTSGAALLALDGTSVTISAADIANPGYARPASFSAGGPRSGDGAQKPEISAPGVSVLSVGVGTGTGGVVESGTSMAAPHTAGIAALVVQEHPKWTAQMIKAALVGTANGAALNGFDTRVDGNGLVNPVGAIATDTLLMTPGSTAAVNFGIQELSGAWYDVRPIIVRNTGSTPATYKLAPKWNGAARGAVVTVTPSTVTVPPHSSTDVAVKMSLSKAAVAALPIADQGSAAVITLQGQIIATPTTNDVPLSLPFIMVPHGRSNIGITNSAVLKVGWRGDKAGTIVVANNGVHAGDADVYSWLLADGKDRDVLADSRALGVQYLASDDVDHPGEPLMVFAINRFDRASTPAQGYYDIAVDADRDGTADHDILIIDDGIFAGTSPTGNISTYVLDNEGGGFVYGAIAPTDSSVVLGFAYPSDLGITADSGPAVIAATSFGYTNNTVDPFTGTATINPFNPQASSGDFLPLAPRKADSFPVKSRRPLADEIPSKGWMVVTLDDASGATEADLVRG